MTQVKTQPRPLYTIAQEISKDWKIAGLVPADGGLANENYPAVRIACDAVSRDNCMGRGFGRKVRAR